jgi:hypothetical protein
VNPATATLFADSNTRSVNLVGLESTVRLVTTIVGFVVGLHWQQHQRPISAETLRKRLHVGAGTARRLAAQLRSDMHVTLGGQAARPTAS